MGTIHGVGKRSLVKVLVRRIRVLTDMRQNTYQARRLLRQAFQTRYI